MGQDPPSLLSARGLVRGTFLESSSSPVYRHFLIRTWGGQCFSMASRSEGRMSCQETHLLAGPRALQQPCQKFRGGSAKGGGPGSPISGRPRQNPGPEPSCPLPCPSLGRGELSLCFSWRWNKDAFGERRGRSGGGSRVNSPPTPPPLWSL